MLTAAVDMVVMLTAAVDMLTAIIFLIAVRDHVNMVFMLAPAVLGKRLRYMYQILSKLYQRICTKCSLYTKLNTKSFFFLC